MSADRIPRGDDGLAGGSAGALCAKHYPPYWLSRFAAQDRARQFLAARGRGCRKNRLATTIATDRRQRDRNWTVLAPDHPWAAVDHRRALAPWRRQYRSTRRYSPPPNGARASTPIRCRANSSATRDEKRRADRIADSIEKALRGELRLPDTVGTPRRPQGPHFKAFAPRAHGPSSTNQWSHRLPPCGEITGLDRTGLLYEMNRDVVEAQPQPSPPPTSPPSAAGGGRVLREPT